MYLLLIFIVIFITTLFFIKNKENFSIKSLFLFLLYGIIWIFTNCILDSSAVEKQKEYKSIPIVSLINKESQETHAHMEFVLGVGGGEWESQNVNYYIVYGKFKKGLRRLKLKDEFQKIFIQESDSITPQIKFYSFRYKYNYSKTKGNWFFDFCVKKKRKYTSWSKNYTKDIIIIVPKNTIFKHFNIKD